MLVWSRIERRPAAEDGMLYSGKNCFETVTQSYPFYSQYLPVFYTCSSEGTNFCMGRARVVRYGVSIFYLKLLS